MVRANARGVVAAVADHLTVRDAAVVQLVAETVCVPRQCGARARSAQPHDAIAAPMTITCAFVRPTTIRFAYVLPELCYDARLTRPVLRAYVAVRSCAQPAILRRFGHPPHRFARNSSHIIRLSRICPQTAVSCFGAYGFADSHRFTSVSIGMFANSAIRIARSSDG